MTTGNTLIIQGGGPTAVFNASLAAVLSETSHHTRFGTTYGAHAGLFGLVRGDYRVIAQLTAGDLELLRVSPGAALVTSRYKPSAEDFEKMIGHLRRSAIRRMIFMGGNGTMRGAEVASEVCRNAAYEVQIICVPKTVDNDIAGTDRSPGFGSAARYIAQSVRDLGMDVRSLPQPVSILETLGRSVGWLAGASTLGKRSEDDAPHLVYVPEHPFSTENFLGDVERVLARQSWAVIVVAEGLRDAAGQPVYQIPNASHADAVKRPLIGGAGAFLAGIVTQHLHIRCRNEKPGLLGRASMAHVSTQDLADADFAGRAAVQALVQGQTDKMVALLPLTRAGHTEATLIDVHAAAGHERTIPPHLLADGPLGINQAFRDYASPLAGPLQTYFDTAAMHAATEALSDGARNG